MRNSLSGPFHPKIRNPAVPDREVSDPTKSDGKTLPSRYGQYNRCHREHKAEFRAHIDAPNVFVSVLRILKKAFTTSSRSFYPVKNFNDEQNILIVPFDFKDKPLQQSPKKARKYFENLFFSQNKLPKFSVADYFKEVSGGKVRLSGDVMGTVRVSYSHKEPESIIHMALEIIEKLVKKNFDFLPYSNGNYCSKNGLKIVDGLVLVHAGSGLQESNCPTDIESKKYSFSSPIEVKCGDEVGYIESFITVPEDAEIGICCHELGHLLYDLPDLYSTEKNTAGVGNWCLMGTGCWNQNGKTPAHLSAHCKAYLGWVDVKILNHKGQYTLKDVKKHKEVLELWGSGERKYERFLLEYREKTPSTYDSFIPGGGLLIWHIDMSKDSNQNNIRRRMVSLEEADGKFSLSTACNHYGDDGDPFPGVTNNREFTYNTTPNSRINLDTEKKCLDSKVRIQKIKSKNGQVSFHYSCIG